MALLKDSFSSLFKYPKRKSINYTNYAETDGITADLRKFETESRQVTLIFMIKHSSENDFYNKYEDFFETINDAGYHTFNLENGLIYKFRYDKTQSFTPVRLFNVSDGATSFTINFIEDEIAIDRGITTPSGGIPLKDWYKINGIDFGDFGVHPDGKIGEVLKYPDAKDSFTDERVYYLNIRRLKHKEVIIPLWIHADSKTEFIRNYQAFYNVFAEAGKLSLYIKEIGATTYCYYLDCTSYSMNWSDKPGAHFSIKLAIPIVTWLSQ